MPTTLKWKCCTQGQLRVIWAVVITIRALKWKLPSTSFAEGDLCMLQGEINICRLFRAFTNIPLGCCLLLLSRVRFYSDLGRWLQKSFTIYEKLSWSMWKHRLHFRTTNIRLSFPSVSPLSEEYGRFDVTSSSAWPLVSMSVVGLPGTMHSYLLSI